MDHTWISTEAGQSAPQSDSSPASTTQSLNPISCIVCRRRKVKCNRILPSCSNCNKGATRCVYPVSARLSRRHQINSQHLEEAANEATLLKRLRQLEGMVAKLGSHVQTSDSLASGSSTTGPALESSTSDDTEVISQDLGRLVFEQGQSRYISSQVWDNLIDEVEDIKDIYASTPGTDDYDSPKQNDTMGQSFFSVESSVDLYSLRPLVSQVSYYWHLFGATVDPLLKVLHLPTMDKTIQSLIITQMKDVSPEIELLMFSIYFAVVRSMTPEDVFSSFGELQSVLSSRYRHGFEQALANADFLRSQELMVVQALIIFLIFAKIDDQRYVWTMTATVVRIAQFIGLHRDGTTFELSPFEVEMRRRVWWWVWSLDLRTAEDFATEPIIARTGFDTRLPLNIEDFDISLDSKILPSARDSYTSMSSLLMRCSLMGPTHHEIYSQPVFISNELGGGPMASGLRTEHIPKVMTFEEMEASVDGCNEYLEKVWLPRCNIDEDPRAWLSVLMARVVILKMRIFIYKPRPGSANMRTQEVREKLFNYTLEVIELENIGATETRAKQWSWWFITMRQWGAMAFVATELCIRKGSPDVLRAWEAMDERLRIWNMESLERQGLGQRKHSLWFPIKRILEKASNVRFNDEFLRARDKHVMQPMLEDEQAGLAFVDPPPNTWDLIDDFQIPISNSESTLFGPYDPMMLSNDWMALNNSIPADYPIPMADESSIPMNPNNLWQN